MNKEIIKELDATLGELIYILGSFEEGSINIVPFEGSWTAAQVGEHLRKSYHGMLKMLSGRTTPTDREPDEKVKEIRRDFGDFSIRMTSPDFVVPGNKQYDREELLQSLSALKTEIVNAANHFDLSETCMEFAFPVYGHLTRLETINFIIVHTQRHIHQLKNIYQKLHVMDIPLEKH